MRVKLYKCIACGSPRLDKIFNLGQLYPCAFLDSIEEQAAFKKDELAINICECGMVQLDSTNSYDDHFKKYWYRSGINKQMIKALKNIVEDTYDKWLTIHNAGKKVHWLDIANNDGTLSKLVKDHDKSVFIVGIDPANDLNNQGNDVFINDYFTANAVKKAIPYDQRIEGNVPDIKFDIITNIAQFYDLFEPGQFLDDVKSILGERGIYVIQMTTLWDTLKSYAIDNFVTEHAGYYPLHVLDKLLKQHGLEIFDIAVNLTNGASTRLYISHIGQFDVQESVKYMIDFQKEDLTKHKIVGWFNEVLYRLRRFKNWLAVKKSEDYKISLLGASTKGHTVSSLCALNTEIVDNALELSEFKFGKICIGSNIPVVDERDTMVGPNKPNILLAMIWHFKSGLLKNFKQFIDDGGTIIFPLPQPHFINSLGEHYI